MATHFLPTGLADFVDREADGLKAKLVNEGNLVELATLQPGVVHKATINRVWGEGTFSYGDCASSNAGSGSVFEAREILACKKTLMDAVCLDDVQEKFGALGGDSAYSDEDAVLRPLAEGALSHFQKQVEVDLWNKAQASQCGSGDLGLYTIISGSTEGVVEITSPTNPATGNTITAVNEVYQNMPESIPTDADLGIFMSVANFRKYLVTLSTSTGAVLGGYDVKSTSNRSLMYIEHPTAPGTLVIGTVGLAGSNRIVGGPIKDIVIGTALTNDALNYQLWYDINDDKVKYRVSAKFGANVASPDFWVSNDLA